MDMSETVVMTVSQLNRYVKGLVETDGALRSIYVSGEISNFVNHYKSGHFYLSLKDESGVIKAVMFRSYAQKLAFEPQNGMKVICRGRVSVFERDGVYQLYIEEMQPDGTGALKLAFDQLTAKLREEGLFDESHKKPIPAYPSRIAVITSPTGAAVQDIMQILARRMPAAEILLCPVLVQGERAAASLTQAVRDVNNARASDLILIGRGGGSLEDLWAFNDETLARAVYASEIPVISCVGHETDFTICDFVADLRAPTPSAAAELAVPDRQEVMVLLKRLLSSARSSISSRLELSQKALKSLAEHPVLRSPESYVDLQFEMLDKLTRACCQVSDSLVAKQEQKLAVLAAQLDAFSPMKTLSRGYAIPFRNGKILRSVEGLRQGDRLDLRLADGVVDCTVNQWNQGES